MRRSWLDVIADLVDAAPAPRWVLYLVAMVVWLPLGTIVGWLSGTRVVPDIDLVFAASAALPLVMLWALQELDDVAARALARLRPVIELDEPGVEGLARALRSTPGAWAWAAIVIGVPTGIASVLGNPGSWGIPADGSGALLAVVLVMAAASTTVMFGFLVHVVHQLRLVDEIHRRSVRVDLFRLEPLYAFATLTARTGMTLIGVGVVGLGAIALIVGPSFSLGLVDAIMVVAVFVVAVACFIVPLLGLHDRIEAEKDHRLATANLTLSTALAEVHRRVAEGEFDAAGKLNDAVAAANAAVLAVSRVSTWPWRPETLRGFLSALGLPILLWLVFEVLGRLLGE